MKHAEILAPVGAMPQLIAACRSGADAVYFGSKNFNARRNAENFGDLSEAVSYCHARGVKAYVTFNTLFTEKELGNAAEEAEYIAKSGADAVILQDLAAAEFFRKICPELPRHASTQMSIHNLSGAKLMWEMGFKRVVLARELSKDEIKYISANCDIELEYFVHGAHCMSVSGQCYMSSVLGGRSGNRGLCAQPCRLNWTIGKKDHALSLKDMSITENIPELEELGICSLKIEGRMKRPEYVYTAVRECVRSRNGEKPDMELLRSVFSRGGFTKGYFEGRRNSSMFGYRTDDDAIETAKVLKDIENLYRNEVGRVSVDFSFSLKSAIPASLTVSDGKNSYTVKGIIPEAAQNSAATADSVRRSLEKCGGTVFTADKIDCDIEDGLFMPKSELNSMRQNALEGLCKLRSAIPERQITSYIFPEIALHTPGTAPKKRVFINSAKQLSEALTEFADTVVMYPEDILSCDKLPQNTGKIAVRLPSYVPALSEKKLETMLVRIRETGIESVFVPNLCALNMAKELGFKVSGMYGLNAMNSVSLEELKKLGVSDTEISFESSFKNLNRISPPLPIGVIVYGRLPLMLIRSCPNADKRGCINCGGLSCLTDRLGKNFPLLCRGRAYQEVLNSCPLWLADKLDDFKKANFLDFMFTVENKNECADVIKAYERGLPAESEFTRGLYYREIL